MTSEVLTKSLTSSHPVFPSRLGSKIVGREFSQYPHMSAFGALLRTSRLNYFHRGSLLPMYGIRATKNDDISFLLSTSQKRQESLAAALATSLSEQPAWSLESWLPFTGKIDWANVSWKLRICPCCTRYGYHTLLFQLPWVERCPIHGEHLLDHCRRCERPLLRDMPHESPLLHCLCGHDAVGMCQ